MWREHHGVRGWPFWQLWPCLALHWWSPECSPAWRPASAQNLELVVLGVWQGLVVLLTLALVAFRGGARDVLALGRPRGAPGVYVAASSC